ncbi:hypothetical protein ACFPOG_20600 [Paenibacillus aestuarii]|uniref:Uncharacterized protein n=1 Tax=Paenibacillus aestuarii TaxID=516965 RepID=A0ABW0KCL0_9BACL
MIFKNLNSGGAVKFDATTGELATVSIQTEDGKFNYFTRAEILANSGTLKPTTQP